LRSASWIARRADEVAAPADCAAAVGGRDAAKLLESLATPSSGAIRGASTIRWSRRTSSRSSPARRSLVRIFEAMLTRDQARRGRGLDLGVAEAGRKTHWSILCTPSTGATLVSFLRRYYASGFDLFLTPTWRSHRCRSRADPEAGGADGRLQKLVDFIPFTRSRT